MRKGLLLSSTFVLVALGAGACSGTSKPSAASVKRSFCGANTAIDKASANVTSAAGFLAVLKAHRSQLNTMKSNLPSGSLGTEARQIVNAADQAIAQNSANPLNNTPSGADLDTYCGVDGNGDPLPSYFATGKGTTFCNGFLPIFQGVSNANTPADVLNVLVSHKTQLAQLATEVSSLPNSIQSKANATVNKAQTAIAQNSAASLKQNGGGSAQDVALYCGQNQ
jgi:hypothetical protein